MKSKPVLVRHWNKAGNTTVLIKLYKEGTIAHNLEAEQITTNPKKSEVRASGLASLVPNGTSVPRLIQAVSNQVSQ
jgi:hypothetical protein